MAAEMVTNNRFLQYTFTRRPSRSKRIASGLFCLGLATGTSATAVAERDIEAGGFLGGHYFNDSNELGIADGTDGESLNHAFTLGLRAAVGIYRELDIEGELAFAPTSQRDTDVGVTAVGVRAHALYHFYEFDKGRLRPFALLGAGSSSAVSDDRDFLANDTDFVFHGGVGVKYAVKDEWGVRLDARLLLPPSTESDGLTMDGELLVGIYKEFGFSDVIIRDDDGDGIRNRDDKCPDKAEDMDGFEDEDGCPEDQDSDDDGIPDSKDQCKDEKEDVDTFEDEDGCPDADNDKDGIDDASDRCPLVAEDADGFEDTDGCVDSDNDGDGIDDEEDKCPMEAETANGFEDSDGCPDELPQVVKKFSGEIEGIRFLRGSAKIRTSSNRVLDAAAAVFLEYKDLRFEIQGHTDNTGTPEGNAVLSQERADSVKAYLVGKGIADDRIESKGYGQDVPVADNETAAGREANRRVEFKLISQKAPAPQDAPAAEAPADDTP